MNKKTYKIITIIAMIIAVIGLVSFFGGIRPVNIGIFVLPALIAVWSFYNYRKG